MNKEFDDFTGMVDDIRKLAEVEYPIIMSPNGRTLAGGHYDIDVNYSERLAYIQGYNKAKETLYTEEQQEISDEEIEKAATLKYADIDYGLFKHAGFVEGCKWYREQLKQRK